MGNSHQTNAKAKISPRSLKKWISVATLKVGESYSPLEFYPHNTTEQNYEVQFDAHLNEVFDKVCTRYEQQNVRFTKEEQVKLKILSRKTKSRFTPLFYFGEQIAGVKDKVWLMNQKQFQGKWDEVFQHALEEAKNQEKKEQQYKKSLEKNNSKQDQRRTVSKTTHTKGLRSTYSIIEQAESDYFKEIYQKKLKILDKISYHAVLAYVFKEEDKSIDQIAQNYYSLEYKCFMENLFESERNCLQTRMRSIISYLKTNKIDILFLQQLSEKGVNMLEGLTKEYRITKTHFKKAGNHSAIMIKKELLLVLEPEKTFWTLGAFNAQYFQNFHQVGQVPSRRNVKEQEKKNDQTSSSLTPMQSNTPLDDSSTRIFIDGSETKIVDLKEDKNYKQELRLIENGQRWRKKLEPIKKSEFSGKTVMSSTYSSLNPHMQSSLKKNQETKDQTRKLNEEFFKELNYPKNTVVQFVGNLILISTQIDQDQMEIGQQNIDDILQMVSKFQEQYQDYTIVMGLDINSELETNSSVKVYNNAESFLKKGFDTVPRLPVLHQNQNPSRDTVMKYFEAADTFTINYMKTNFQYERAQVSQKIIGCNNFIISTDHFQSSVIETVKGKKVNARENLPNKNHPFINYFVRAQIYHTINFKNP